MVITEEWMMRRHRIVLAYCKQMQWPTDLNKLSMEQVMQVRKLECWIQSPNRLKEPILTAKEILQKISKLDAGVISTLSVKYLEDAEKADLFIKEHFMQTLTNRNTYIKSMGEEIVKDIELYFQTRD